MQRFRLGWILLLLAAMPAIYGSDRWALPAAEPSSAGLPKLDRPLIVDGRLTEWKAAACVPVRYPSYFVQRAASHQWRGPEDAGMEVYAGWNKDGLCLAAHVADDEVINTRKDDTIWQQDCVEFFVDGRSQDKLMKPPYTRGAYQLLIRPPAAGKRAGAVVNQRHGEIAGLKLAARKTPVGYTVEVMIPWSAFPGFSPKPGRQIGIQFTLDEYDKRDGKSVQPLVMSYRGAKELWQSPQNFIRWSLVAAIKTGKGVPLGPLAAVDMPSVAADNKPLPISVEIGSSLAGRTGAVSISATDSLGKQVIEKRIAPKALPAPWHRSVKAQLRWPPGKIKEDGFCSVRIVAYDRKGKPLGEVRRPLLIVRNTLSWSLLKLKAANLPKLSKENPYKAAAYLGTASAMEKFKRSIEISDIPATVQAAQEVSARLDLLEKGKIGIQRPGLLDLLTLAARPEAQAVVEYPFPSSGNGGAVTFSWGAIPLVIVNVQQLGSAADAIRSLESSGGWIVTEPAQKTAVGGMPAMIQTGSLTHEPLDLGDFDPERQFLIVLSETKVVGVLALKDLDCVKARAVVILPGCPQPVRETVEAWAREKKLPTMPLPEGMKKDRLLIAGDIRAAGIPEKIKGYEIIAATLLKGGFRVTVASGLRLISATSPSRKVAERAVRMVAAGKPVRPEEVDALRMDLVKELAPETSYDMPKDLALYCGDLHMHTFHSDGSPSPAGLLLQAMHCGMDFAAVTDHNTLDGALIARALLGRYGFAYPMTVGEEITMSWSHMNAYPVKSLISWELSPEETVRAAHRQGAAIQWNHPGYPGKTRWETDHLKTGIGITEIDAWEHLPSKHDAWKEAGVLPMITGTTDTHDGTFSWSERTVIFAPSPNGEAIAGAIRSGNSAAVIHAGGRFFYGPDRAVSLAWSALKEGKALKTAWAARMRKTLQRADLAGLLKASRPRPVTLKETGMR